VEGAHADLLVVDANPYDGLECFSQHENKIVGVIQAGRPVRDDLNILSPA
jgi:imidazolonepropionase-like amidohydrolase